MDKLNYNKSVKKTNYKILFESRLNIKFKKIYFYCY